MTEKIFVSLYGKTRYLRFQKLNLKKVFSPKQSRIMEEIQWSATPGNLVLSEGILVVCVT